MLGLTGALEKILFFERRIPPKHRDDIKWKKILRSVTNLRSDLLFQMLKDDRVSNLNCFEKKVFSQNGEDGIIRAIFYRLKTTNRYFVEFGVEDGMECNTRLLRERMGWEGLMMDSRERNPPHIKRELITAENINSLLRKHGVPGSFDLLCIDIDLNDYWVWDAIRDFEPRAVVIEYNSSIPPNESLVVEYDPKTTWDGTNRFGASLLALVRLGKRKGYTLVACDNTGTNAFFVKDELVEGNFAPGPVAELYRPPGFGKVIDNRYTGHPPGTRKMIEV